MADTRDTKDLDFDELHNAVNALMNQTQKGKPAKKQPSEPRPPKETVANKDKEIELHHVPVTIRRPLPQLMTHHGSRGRAMDVVGPRVTSPATPPSAKPKRQAPDLHPTKPVEPEPIAPMVQPVSSATPTKQADQELADDVLASLNLQDTAQPSEEAPTLANHHSEWPDPLDMQDAADKAEKADHKEPTEPEAAEEPEKPNDTATPFVATKVEKRPLGAYADAANDKTTMTDGAEDNSKAEVPAPAPTPAQPAELSPEVVAVESDEPAFKPNTTERSSNDVTDLDSLRTMAIPQQYKEKHSAAVASEAKRPVFDTKEYHPAIDTHANAASRSSMKSWAMGITLLVLLVAALGVAYYLITGSLDFSALFGR